MELNNEFRVAVPSAKVWEMFTDGERVAPCLPGATLLSADGDTFHGAVKVKVGPITVSYKGTATYKEKDVAGQRIVLRAEGKETRGSGTAAATVTAQLKDEGDATHVGITTDLAISGKAAQFGRGVLADVANSGTLFAFAVVAITVLGLRRTEPGRRRPFRTPGVVVVAPLAAAGCLYLFLSLSRETQILFVGWAVIGLVVYFLYGYRKSHVARGLVELPELAADAPHTAVPPMPGAPAPGERQ